MTLPSGGVWLDVRGTQSVDHGERGIARYIAEQAKAILSLAPDAIGAVGLDPELPHPRSLEPLAGSPLMRPPRRDDPGVTPRPGIYHVMSPFEPSIEIDDIWPRWAREGDTKLVVTLYDLIPLVFRNEYLTDEAWGVWGTVWQSRLGLIRSADRVLTISRRTALDAQEHLGIPEERITVIDSGVSPELPALAETGQAEALVHSAHRRIRPGYVLYVGGGDPRKNLRGTIRAYAQVPEEVREKHQLVIACKLTRFERIGLMRFARGLGIRRRDLVLTGFVPDRELAALYRACELFVFPSLYEGAGLPVLEAMSCGAPVAASATSSIPEILGDMEATFDPSDPADIASTITVALTKPGELERLRDRSAERVRLFTWDRVAERTLDGYARALDASPAPAGI